MSGPPGSPPPPPSSRPPPPAPIREFADRSAQWLFEDPQNVRGLVEILEPELAELLNFGRAQRVNRTFVPADFQEEESDLVYLVPFRDEVAGAVRDVWIYFLLEHQSKRDPLMGLRVLLYMCELWGTQRREWDDAHVPAERRQLRPILPLVLYTGAERWSGPIDLASAMELPAVLERFIPRWETLLLPLNGTPAETLTRFSTAIGWALRLWQAERAPREEMERALRQAMAGLEGLSQEQAGQWARAATFFAQLIFQRREEQSLIELFWGEVRGSKFREHEEVIRMGLTLEQQAEARGAARGAEQQARAALETVLTARFGTLPDEIRRILATANTETMNTWLQSAATASTLDEVGIPRQAPS